MVDIIQKVIGIIFLVGTGLYIISKILKTYPKGNSIKKLLIFIFAVSIVMINYEYSSPMFKLFNNTIILIFASKLLFDRSFLETSFSVFIEQLLVVIAEFIFVFIITVIFNVNKEQLLNNLSNGLLVNCSIAIICLLISQLKFVDSFFTKTITYFKNLTLRNNRFILIPVFSLIIINLLMAVTYYKVNMIFLLIINNSFILFIMFVLYKNFESRNNLLEEQNRITLYKAENNALINNLNEYEKIADQHRVINHENRNQLSSIKQMIINKDDGIVNYIDNLIGKTIPDNEKIIEKTKRIPSGGLQGIIYQKMLVMDKEKVKYSLNISRDLKELDFKKLDIDTNVDLCKIVGVFIDNAIQEVSKLEDKIVDIELYVEKGKFCIGITNNYGKNKDFSVIDELGYSTKGKEHGYGLSLVKELLENNTRFENERKITSKYFTQIIKVNKMKSYYKKKKD